jgi:hypothetical protein
MNLAKFEIIGIGFVKIRGDKERDAIVQESEDDHFLCAYRWTVCLTSQIIALRYTVLSFWKNAPVK